MVGSQTISGVKFTIGIAYIALPSDFDRAQYIRDCFQNNYVSIVTEDGGFYNRVPISPEILNFIEFPLTPKELGTPIVYGTEDLHQQPFVLIRLVPKETLGDNKEYQFKFKKQFEDQFVEISGSAKDHTLNLMVGGEGKKPGKIKLTVINQSDNSEVEIDVSGDCKVNATKQIILEQGERFIARVLDKDDNKGEIDQTVEELNVRNKKVIINDGKDPLTLGNELKTFLEEFIDKVASITVATAIGAQPIINKIEVMDLKKKLDTFLSQVIYIDK